MGSKLSTSRLLAPEEVREGQYVVVHSRVIEMFAWWRLECAPTEPASLDRLSVLPECEPMPMEVVGVCLPYVLVRDVDDGRPRTLDVRRDRLSRVSGRFARSVARAYRPKKRPKRKRRS